MKPTVFGRYTLIEQLGSGGMAEVFLAKTASKGLERLVAIKRIHSHLAADNKFTSMFIDEANLAAKLTHANIAQIFDLGKVDGQYFIAMEYVHGRDLRALFRYFQSRRQGVPMAQSCYIVAKLCEGLDYAHNRKDYSGRELGLVHRDVSLNNLILSFDGELKIIDFGVAKAAIGRHTRTETGFVKGKIAYMSPEQLGRRPVDCRSDVFACGIILFEILSGQRLYLVPSLHDLVRKVRNAEVPRLRELDPSIPEELEQIVVRALQKSPGDRFQTAGDMHDALSQFMQKQGGFMSRSQVSAWMIDLFREHYEAESARIAALWERSKQIELERPLDPPETSEARDDAAHPSGSLPAQDVAKHQSARALLDQSLSGEVPTDVFQPYPVIDQETAAAPSNEPPRKSAPVAVSGPLESPGSLESVETTSPDVIVPEQPIEERLPLPSPDISVDQLLEVVPRIPRRAQPFAPTDASKATVKPDGHEPSRKPRTWLMGLTVLGIVLALAGLLAVLASR